MGSKREVEIKLSLPSAAHGRRLLRQAGFRVMRRRVYEDNLVFDTPQGKLRSGNLLLRLRVAGPVATLTFKGPPSKGRHKSRFESETAVSDPAACREILHRLGFRQVYRYEKYRTEYWGRTIRAWLPWMRRRLAYSSSWRVPRLGSTPPREF